LYWRREKSLWGLSGSGSQLSSHFGRKPMTLVDRLALRIKRHADIYPGQFITSILVAVNRLAIFERKCLNVTGQI
jgi:hypothetical protein